MTKTIVIHPGSRSLRIGRASDAFPVTIPNVIARKIGDSAKGQPRPSPIVSNPRPLSLDPTPDSTQVPFEDEDHRPLSTVEDLDPVTSRINSLRSELRTRMRLYKLRGTLNANEQAFSFNAASRAEKVAEYNDPDEIEWTNASEDAEYYLGEEVINTTPCQLDRSELTK
jgi:actin-related protein 8